MMNSVIIGTNIIQLNDDREEIVRERYKIYQRNTYPVIEFIEKITHYYNRRVQRC